MKVIKNIKRITVDIPEEEKYTPPPVDYPISKEELIELYYDKKMSVRQVAEELGRGATTIRRWMEKYDLPRRNYSDSAIIHYDNLRENNGNSH